MDADTDERRNLHRLVAEMKQLPSDDDGDFFALTLTGSEEGTVQYAWFSEWKGVSEGTPRYDLRGPALVRPSIVAELWSSMGIGCVKVTTPTHLGMYLRIGGAAFIEAELARVTLADIFMPVPSTSLGPLGAPVTISMVEEQARNHAPTPKLRMQVLKRDGFRCRVCGRSPSNHVDIELHVHHIRPWANGGLTLTPNLVTLCHTCHKGLDPHHEPRLFDVIQDDEPIVLPSIRAQREEHLQAVSRYRAIVTRMSSPGVPKRQKPGGASKKTAKKSKSGLRR